jgi:peptidylprolyl isomerase
MNKKTIIAVAAAIVVVLFFVGSKILLGMSSGGQDNIAPVSQRQITTDNQSTNTTIQQDSATAASNIQTVGGIEYEDTVVGTGTEAVVGKTVTVNYVGVLQNGTKFDASADHGQPFSFPLGAGKVIQGWDTGVAGMKVGGTRILVIPPALGYGANAMGPIPANSTLIFEVQLVDVK